MIGTVVGLVGCSLVLGLVLGVTCFAAWRAPRGRPCRTDSARRPADLRELVDRLSPVARQALESAAALALVRSHYRVEVEHWLLRLAEDPDADLAQLFFFYELLTRPLHRDLAAAVGRFPEGCARVPILAPDLVRLLGLGWDAARREFDATHLRSGHVLFAALADGWLAARLDGVSPEFAKLDRESLRDHLGELVPAAEEPQWY